MKIIIPDKKSGISVRFEDDQYTDWYWSCPFSQISEVVVMKRAAPGKPGFFAVRRNGEMAPKRRYFYESQADLDEVIRFFKEARSSLCPGSESLAEQKGRERKETRRQAQETLDCRGNRHLAAAGFKVTTELLKGSRISLKPWVYVDEISKRWAVLKGSSEARPEIYEISDVAGVEIRANVLGPKGKAGRTIVGGLALGPIGALAGAASGKPETCNRLDVVVSMKSLRNPTVSIPLISSNVKTNSSAFKALSEESEKIASAFKLLIDRANEERASEVSSQDMPASDNGLAGELTRISELYEKGLLSDEEFEAAKRKCLGL